MAVIDFDTDILGLSLPPLGPATDEPYATGEADFPTRYDDVSEQRIIVMMDIMRAYLETLTRRDELQRFHHTMSRILGEVAYNRVYDDLGARTESNVPVPSTAGGETLGAIITDPDGVDSTTLAPLALAASASTALVVANINGLGLPFGAEIEAYAAANGRVGIQLTAVGIAAGSTFTLSGTFPALTGIAEGPHVSAVRATARRARDKGLEHFHREIRAEVQP